MGQLLSPHSFDRQKHSYQSASRQKPSSAQPSSMSSTTIVALSLQQRTFSRAVALLESKAQAATRWMTGIASVDGTVRIGSFAQMCLRRFAPGAAGPDGYPSIRPAL